MIHDMTLFREKVLKGLESSQQELQSCRAPMLPHWVQDEIKALGYVKKTHRKAKCVCPLFCVPRPDGKLRLIWDGRKLNSLCRSPPRFHLHTVLDHLHLLFQPKIKKLFTFDMKSWFCQLGPSPKIAKFFSTKLYDGLYIVLGLPMGWAWAPIIAQFAAEGVAAAIAQVLPELRTDGIIIIYIDNLILGLPEPLASNQQHVFDAVKRVCDRLGAIIKAGSEFWGDVVEWLGLEVDCQRYVFRLKQAFVEKLKGFQLSKVFSERPSRSIRWWYSLMSCIIYAFWNTTGTLCFLSNVIWIMSHLGKLLREPGNNWDSEVEIPKPRQNELLSLFLATISNEWRRLPLTMKDMTHHAVGFSDASNSGLAWAFHSEKTMVLKTWTSPSNGNDIFERELDAMIDGQTALIHTLPPLSGVRWFGDNMGALFVSRREMSCLWKMNPKLESLHLLKQHFQVVVEFEFVDSANNIMDGPSRSSYSNLYEAPNCAVHPGQFCSCFLAWIKSFSA